MVDWLAPEPIAKAESVDWLAPEEKFQGPRRVEDTGGAADVSDVAVASLMRETEDRIKFYAKELGVPKEKFGVFEGDIVYQKEDGSLQPVAPGFARGVARGVGPSFPAVGGTVGAIVGVGAGGGAGSVPAGIAGGALGAAGGEAARQNLANWLGGQEASVADISRDAAVEGAFDIGASLTGLLVAKGISRVAASRAAKQVKALIKSGGKSTMDALETTLKAVNKEYGTDIRLTPGELSNAPRLAQQQVALANTPEGAEKLMPFYGKRGDEFDTAFKGLMKKHFAPYAFGADVAGENLSTSAKSAVRAIQKQRVIQGSPEYQRAFANTGPVDISDAIGVVDAKMEKASRPLRSVLNRVKTEMTDPIVDKAGKVIGREPITDLETIQNRVKEMLDDEISSAYKRGLNKQGNALKDVQDTLLERLDNQSPLYQAARAKWGDLSGPVSVAQGGVLQQIADAPAREWATIGEKIFKRASPAEIARARKAIYKVPGGAEKWNTALRSFLEDAWEQAGREYKSTLPRQELGRAARPVSFWATFQGDPKMRNRLQAALSPRQKIALKRVLDVMEATGRAINFNSTTAMQLEGGKMLRTPSGVSGTLRTFSAQPLEPVARVYEEWVQGQNLELLADVITQKDSVDALIKTVSAKSPRYVMYQSFARALNLVRAEAVGVPEEGPLPQVQPPGKRTLEEYRQGSRN